MTIVFGPPEANAIRDQDRAAEAVYRARQASRDRCLDLIRTHGDLETAITVTRQRIKTATEEDVRRNLGTDLETLLAMRRSRRRAAKKAARS